MVENRSGKSLLARPNVHFAPELWMEIFEWACRDSGATGRSLGLVNKDFRRLSRPYAYQSIYLPRPKDIMAFREHLHTLPPDQKKVRFLHSPCPHIFMGTLSLDDDIEYEDEEEDEDEDSEGVLDQIESEDPPFREALRDILNQASSSLLVLSLFWRRARNPVFLDELLVPLPRLEELHFKRLTIALPSDVPPFQPPTFPNLCRLYISGQNIELISMGFNDLLFQMAPRLTHLIAPIYHLRSLKAKLQDSVQVVVVDPGPSVLYRNRRASQFYDDVAKSVFGGPPANGKVLTFLGDDECEWLDRIDSWEARWKLSEGARNQSPWLTW